ncbi:MAG: lipid A biosynthesis lauroyl acyltransferase [Gammaproteobacteria bacterium]|nr:MAG: lipid A biosynthesis lauroyl acyltransferase [Gammaproteobacteria bacterium]
MNPPVTESSKLFRAAFLAPRYWPTWVGIAVLRLIVLLPLPVIALLGSALGAILYFLFPTRRHIALRNIERCFPEWNVEAQRRLVRKNFRVTGRSALEITLAWWSSYARLHRLVQCRNRQYYEQAVAGDKPVILLFGHFVAVEMAGMYVSSERPAIDIYKAAHNKLMDAFITKSRLRFAGARVVEVREGIKVVVRAVKSGKTLLYLPDQDPGRRRGIFVPFMGIQTATFDALGKLTRLTNATVVPCFIKQLPWGRGYEIIFKPALKGFPSGDNVADTTTMNAAIEEAVREMPDQYFWVHKRFKTRPEGEEDFYAS